MDELAREQHNQMQKIRRKANMADIDERDEEPSRYARTQRNKVNRLAMNDIEDVLPGHRNRHQALMQAT